MGQVKGVGIAAVLEYLRRQYGARGIQQLRCALDSRDQECFDKPVRGVAWVDFGYYMRMIVTADRVLGRGDYGLVEAAARYNMRKNYSGLFSVFTSALSPRFIINQANTMWRQWFDSGWMEREWLGETQARLILTDFQDMPPLHEYNLNPSFDEILQILGASKTVCRHTHCVLKGEPACQWELEWH